MSYILKGDPAAQLVAIFPSYNAETKVYVETHEYRGTQNAIRGMELQFQAGNLSYRITHDGPIWSIQVDVPQQSINETIDRWEIFTESTEKSLFELPVVTAAAVANDALLAEGEKTFKQLCEESAETHVDPTFFLQSVQSVALEVIDHLRAQVTGWQVDFIVIRRTRRIDKSQSPGFRMTLDAGLYVYNSGQLGIPNNLGFVLPVAPTVDPSVTIYRWGWRKRSQRVEDIGQYSEQTVELVFAPWSTLAYTDATSDLIW